MLPTAYRITRVQKTLRWFEEDIPLLNMRVKDLSVERQRSARQFAAAVVSQTRAELDRLLKEQPAAAYIAGTYDNLMRQFVFQAEVEVVRERCALRPEHGVQRNPQVVPQPGRRRFELRNHPIRKRIAQRIIARRTRIWAAWRSSRAS